MDGEDWARLACKLFPPCLSAECRAKHNLRTIGSRRDQAVYDDVGCLQGLTDYRDPEQDKGKRELDCDGT